MFEYAMSWRRAFQRIYDKYTWLKQFARINVIAVETFIGEMTQDVFEAEAGNAFKTTFLNKCNVLHLYNRKHSTRKVKKMIEDFAALFTGKDVKSALAELNQSRRSVRSKDAVPIACLAGVNITLLVFQWKLDIFLNKLRSR